MAFLEITETKSKAMDELETEAIKVVREALEKGGDIDDGEKAAVKVLAVSAKNRQTLTAREGIRWSMVSTLDNPKEREKYIRLTQPEIKKALTA